MELLPADYVIGGVTLVMAVTGLFRGFSGTLAFVVALSSAGLFAKFGWPYTLQLTEVTWVRSVAISVGTLLVFGIIRLIIKKIVNGLLAQPSDAILGFVVGASIGAIVVVIWAYSGLGVEYSNLVQLVIPYVQ